MRRGQTASVFQSCGHLGELLAWFVFFLKQLQAKVRAAGSRTPGDSEAAGSFLLLDARTPLSPGQSSPSVHRRTGAHGQA